MNCYDCSTPDVLCNKACARLRNLLLDLMLDLAFWWRRGLGCGLGILFCDLLVELLCVGLF